ncbi:hypothetical protein NXY07_27175 [Phocaeicola dorei]|nr:hypothetical protein [Phocaeicola dorei]
MLKPASFFRKCIIVNTTTFTVKDAKGDVVAGLNGAKAATLVAKGITPSFDKDGKAVTDKIAAATTVKTSTDNEKAASNFQSQYSATIEVV